MNEQVGPIHVDYMELHRLANATATSADDFGRLSLSVGATAFDHELIISHVLDPVGSARVDWALGEAVARFASLIVRLNIDATRLEAAVEREREADGSVVWEVANPLMRFAPVGARIKASSAPNPLIELVDIGAWATAGRFGAGAGAAIESSYRPDWAGAPIRSLSAALNQVGDVEELEGGIAIQKIEGEVPRYVVLLPGLQAVGFTPHPRDVPGAAAALASKSTSYDRAVVKAMKAVGVPAGAEVVFIGYSQGGLAAMNLAGNPEFNGSYVKVTHVLAAASPISRKEVLPGSGTKVLAVENVVDPVPHADNWDSAARRSQPDRYLFAFADGRAPIGGHDLTAYVDHLGQAEEYGKNPDLRAFSEGLDDFFKAPTTTKVFTLRDNP